MPQSPDSHFPAEQEILSHLVDRGVLLLDSRMNPEFANPAAYSLLACAHEADLKQRWETIKPLLQIEKNLPQKLQAQFFKVDLPLKQGSRCLRAEIHVRDEKFGSGYLLLLKDRQKMDSLDINLLLASQAQTQIYLQGGLAHDLRAPLNAMHITLELLGETLTDRSVGDDESSQQRCIAVMKQELVRLNHILQAVLAPNTLLNFARQEFDLRAMLEEITALLQTSARRYRVDLQCQLPEREVKLTGQREGLKQALINIAVNRMQKMPNGGKLEMQMKLENSSVSIVINDQGPVLSAAQRAQIYALAFAAENKCLGLYVARMLVELHDGAFEIASPTNPGNCFTLTLPLVRNAVVDRTVNVRQAISSSEKI